MKKRKTETLKPTDAHNAALDENPSEIARLRAQNKADRQAHVEYAEEHDRVSWAMADWLDRITGSAFFGATAPDESSMKFTITITAAEWRVMRALVDASGAGAYAAMVAP